MYRRYAHRSSLDMKSGGKPIPQGSDAAANAIAGFEYFDVVALQLKSPCSSQSGHAGTNDSDLAFLAWFAPAISKIKTLVQEYFVVVR
jgi:predicted NAD/FAD-dependent oxidoreductase